MRYTTYAVFVASVMLAACASAGSGTPSPSPSKSATQAAADSSRLTQAEIDAADLPTAYELVSRLRRRWLRHDGPSGAEVAVYIDERPVGGAAKLREMRSAEIAELQYVPNADAIRRWGMSVTGAVIVVVRRR